MLHDKVPSNSYNSCETPRLQYSFPIFLFLQNPCKRVNVFSIQLYSIYRYFYFFWCFNFNISFFQILLEGCFIFWTTLYLSCLPCVPCAHSSNAISSQWHSAPHSDYMEHNSMAYGADWCPSALDNVRNLKNDRAYVMSGSFYDHALHLWQYMPGL